MKEGGYPTPIDVTGPLEKSKARAALAGAPKKIEWAIQETERLLKKSIRLKKVEVKDVFLSDQPYLIPEFPVKDVKIFGEGREAASKLFRVDEETGIIFPHLPLLTYTVSYQVGYGEGELPATIQYLILELAIHELDPTFSPDHEEKVRILLTVASRLWINAEVMRNGVGSQTGRSGPGEEVRWPTSG